MNTNYLGTVARSPYKVNHFRMSRKSKVVYNIHKANTIEASSSCMLQQHHYLSVMYGIGIATWNSKLCMGALSILGEILNFYAKCFSC